jgi:ketosteroid isomerase-like protein
MKRYLAIRSAARIFQTIFVFLFAVTLVLTCASTADAQKEKKKKKDNTPPADSSNTTIPLSDEQQIDYMLSEMLGAWQLGDIEKLHKDYADDVSIVNGSWAPPIIGWTNYLAVYQQQRTRMQQVRMDRLNTYIKVSGTAAWACYQWDFEAVVDGQPSTALGQTTVVLEKRNNRWVIVHNHTSLASAPPPANPPAKPADSPAKPPGR